MMVEVVEELAVVAAACIGSYEEEEEVVVVLLVVWVDDEVDIWTKEEPLHSYEERMCEALDQIHHH